jgi:hypothetical protein
MLVSRNGIWKHAFIEINNIYGDDVNKQIEII